MKTQKQSHFLLFSRLIIICLSIIILSVVSMHAQNTAIAKGYGNALYQGLQDDLFLRKWMVLGPVAISDKPGEPANDILKNAFNKDLFTVVTVDNKKNLQPVDYSAKKYIWQYVESKSDTIRLNKILGDTNFVYCYALAEVIAAEPSKALIGLGSDDGVKMWINGKEVHSNFVDRAITPDEDIFEVSLNKGGNQILLKIQNSRGEYGFCLRQVSKSSVSKLLLKSSANGDFDNVKTLLAYSPEINIKGQTGLTSWQFATIKGRAEIADYLKGKGAITTFSFPPLSVYIDSLFAGISGRKAPGGAVLVAKNGDILFEKGYGLADIGYRIPVSPVTKFRIGSITKQFIASRHSKIAGRRKNQRWRISCRNLYLIFQGVMKLPFIICLPILRVFTVLQAGPTF